MKSPLVLNADTRDHTPTIYMKICARQSNFQDFARIEVDLRILGN